VGRTLRLLILIKPSEEMMAVAIQHYQAYLPMPVKITPLCNWERKGLTITELKTLQEHQPLWFINASLSLHHIPIELKKLNLERLNSLSTFN
jgi:hypothetical protein